MNLERFLERIRALEKENTELKSRLLLADKKVHKGENWSQNILDSIPNPVFIKNENSCFVTVNSAFCDFVNKGKEELLGKSDRAFFSESEAEVFLRVDQEVLTNGKTNWNEEEITIDGRTHNLITSKVRITDGNGNYYVLGLITDITDNKDQQVILKKQKDELENEKKNVQVLLREVHHRVKNNMQVVSSLLSLQMRKFDESKVHEAFINCKSRIVAMAKVHEILYQTENFSSINFASYINALIENLKLSSNIGNNIRFRQELINVFINVDIAIPMGMAINEIVTNSIKHGLVEGERLNIYLKMSISSGVCSLELGDDGRGNVPELGEGSTSFGTELIKLFCQQIDAQLDAIEKEKGVHYKISFATKRKRLSSI